MRVDDDIAAALDAYGSDNRLGDRSEAVRQILVRVLKESGHLKDALRKGRRVSRQQYHATRHQLERQVIEVVAFIFCEAIEGGDGRPCTLRNVLFSADVPLFPCTLEPAAIYFVLRGLVGAHRLDVVLAHPDWDDVLTLGSHYVKSDEPDRNVVGEFKLDGLLKFRRGGEYDFRLMDGDEQIAHWKLTVRSDRR